MKYIKLLHWTDLHLLTRKFEVECPKFRKSRSQLSKQNFPLLHVCTGFEPWDVYVKLPKLFIGKFLSVILTDILENEIGESFTHIKFSMSCQKRNRILCVCMSFETHPNKNLHSMHLFMYTRMGIIS
jgi:hypothetical protein